MEKFQGLTPGSVLDNGTYRIEKVLGRGGFGITYLATDIKLARLVAIKEFFPKNYCNRDNTTSKVTLSTEESKELIDKLKNRFLKEARHIASFDNPGIVRIHTVFEENDTAYYVMDYIEGFTLSDMVKHDGPLPEGEALKYVEKVGAALEYIHAKMMNHFDVKPANILVRKSDDQPVLIDFGLSKQFDSNGEATTTGIMGVSHGYAPPEQYNAEKLKEFSPRTDLYSLAATLYYILSGVVPPSAMTLLEEDLTFPQEIPVELIKPISKAMMPARKKRHETINAFIKDLKEAVREKPAIEQDLDSSTEIWESKEPKIRKPDENTTDESDEEKSGSWMKWVWMGLGCVLILIAIYVYHSCNSFTGSTLDLEEGDPNIVEVDSVKSDSELAEIEDPGETFLPQIRTVKDLYWKSPLGVASYSGEVLVDPLNDRQLPHGRGIARIIKGEFEDCVYDGEFVDGKMEGQTTYTTKEGDIFKGTFKNNKYYKGRYTVKSTGDYFEGGFNKEGDPDLNKGAWYDKAGNKI